MDLAAGAALARVPVNLDRLFSDPDPDYRLWVGAVVSRVSDAQREIAEQAKRGR